MGAAVLNGTVEDTLRVARAEVNYVEGGGHDGRSGNITKFWHDCAPGLQGQPWCACFQRWVNIHAHTPDLPVSNPYYCPSLVTYAKQHGLWDDSGHYSAGDLVFFDFNGHGIAEHIGRVLVDDGKVVVTIEGNTSPEGVAGSQANGGGVYQRHRPHGPMILGVLKYSKLCAHPAAKHTDNAAAHKGSAPRKPVKHNPNPIPATDVHFGAKGDDVKFIQWAIGAPVDGVFGKQTDHAVREFQRYHGLVADGVVGTKTRSELAKVTH